jgi:hypothetical protein
MTALVGGQTRAGYQQMIGALEPAYQRAPGFILHMSHEVEQGWCVMDVWQSRADFEQFYRAHVLPRLPADLRPKIRVQELEDALPAGEAFRVPSA